MNEKKLSQQDAYNIAVENGWIDPTTGEEIQTPEETPKLSQDEAQKIALENGWITPEEINSLKESQAAANRARAAELERAPGWTDDENALERANEALFRQGTAKVAKMAASETARTGDFLQAAATLPFSAAAKAAGLKKNWTTYMGAGDAIDEGIDKLTNDYTKLSEYEEPMRHVVGVASGFGPAGLVGKGISKVGSKLLETGFRGTGLPGKYISKVGEIAQEGAKVNAGNIGATVGSEIGGAIGGIPGAIAGGIAGAKAGPKAHGYFNEDVAKQNAYETAIRTAKRLGIDPSVIDDAFKSGNKITLGQASDKEWVRGLENYAAQSPTGSIPLAPIYEEQRGNVLKKLGNLSEKIENQDITGSNIISKGVKAKTEKEAEKAAELIDIVNAEKTKAVPPSQFYKKRKIEDPAQELEHKELIDVSDFLGDLTKIENKHRDPKEISKIISNGNSAPGMLNRIRDLANNLKKNAMEASEKTSKLLNVPNFSYENPNALMNSTAKTSLNLPNKIRHDNLLQIRKEIGDLMNDQFGLVSKSNASGLKKLYHQINKKLDAFYEGISPQAHSAWKKYNKNYNIYAQTEKGPLNEILQLEKKGLHTNLFETLYSKSTKDVRALNAITEHLEPQQAQELHRQFMMRLGKDKHSEFSLVKFAQNYSKLPSNSQEKLINLATKGMSPTETKAYRDEFRKNIKSIKRNAKTLDHKDVTGDAAGRIIKSLSDAPAIAISTLGSLASIPGAASVLAAKLATPYGLGKFASNQKRMKSINEALGSMSAKELREAKRPTGEIVRGLLKAAQNSTR